jgi:hypothetical protein
MQTHTKHPCPVGLEPTILASERVKTVHALHRSATETGKIHPANLFLMGTHLSEKYLFVRGKFLNLLELLKNKMRL